LASRHSSDADITNVRPQNPQAPGSLEVPVVIDDDIAAKPTRPGGAALPPIPGAPGGQAQGTANTAIAPGPGAPAPPIETAAERQARAQAKASHDAARREWLNSRVTPPAAGKAVPEPVLALDLGRELGQKGLAATEEIEIVQSIFSQFRRHYKENPVGENYEITATLTGANKKKISYLSPDHTSINERGELCDHWGNPFWFHSMSKDVMEVVSAGPDGKLHTDDDVKMQ